MSELGPDMEAGPWTVYGIAILDEESGEWDVLEHPDEGWMEFYQRSDALTFARRLGVDFDLWRIVERDITRWRFSELTTRSSG